MYTKYHSVPKIKKKKKNLNEDEIYDIQFKMKCLLLRKNPFYYNI